ncbi:MAG: prepilin-type N-terminal cleavage/methylation domain-containing protein [Nostocales cyanobacterium]|nr:MAG: prepilin-type N-terminal cleavage/methylation domain-containing protein [Nostocales cyanobacterium]
MKSYIKNPKSDVDVNTGFTLVELLVAAVIMSIVVTLAGTGFVAILQQNRKAEFESRRRADLNRTLDYIANDIRTATKIEAGASGEVMKLTISELQQYISPTTAKVYYEFKKPYFISYSIANSSGVWTDSISDSNLRSKSINRIKTLNTTPPPTPTPDFLVDGIRDPRPNPTSTPTPPSCPSGSTRRGADGFYTCIYTGGTKADVYLYGKLSNTDSRTLEVKTTVFTRATSPN